VAPAEIVPQVFVSVKSPLLVPVSVALVTVNEALPVFVTRITLTALDVPTIVSAKVTLGGVNEIPEAIPVPVRGTVCGLLLALSVTVSVPGITPVVPGVKLTLMLQLAPLATEVPQLLVCE